MDASQLFPTQANPKIPDFGPGDTVRVNFRIREGERERIQAFQGVVIRRQKRHRAGVQLHCPAHCRRRHRRRARLPPIFAAD